MLQTILAIALIITHATTTSTIREMTNAAGTIAAQAEQAEETTAPTTTAQAQPEAKGEPQFEIMQDLTQCVVVHGVILCIDKCGGRSEPGTICTVE